jgi:hypothetical protein
LRSRARGRGGFLFLPFIILLLLRGKISAGGKSLLRNTRCVRRKQNSRGEQTYAEKRQTHFIAHGKSFPSRLIVDQPAFDIPQTPP